jgi:predicted amidohydrolase
MSVPAEAHPKVAAIQLMSGSNTAHNVARAVALVHRAADEGARYIQVPEYFNYYGPARGFSQVAESIPGPTTELFADIARSRGVVVHLGSMLEKSSVDGKYFNTSVVIDGAGRIVATYRKVHLFDVDVPDLIRYRESEAIEPGNGLAVVALPDFTLGLSVCFDLRFPELYRSLALLGANVLAVPSAFSAPTGRVHWDVLVKARAIENHAFVIAAAQVGTTEEGLSTYGHSMIVGPWGEVLAESLFEGEDMVCATLDIGDVNRRRAQIPVLELRRPDVYDLP